MSARKNISDEAVEAAYSELPDGAGVYVDRHDLRVILEAAAPHLMAQAWEEGWHGGAGWPQEEVNPYRAAGAGE